MKYREAKNWIESKGFSHVRRSDGSHHIFRNNEGKTVILVEHHNKEIPQQILAKLRKQVG